MAVKRFQFSNRVTQDPGSSPSAQRLEPLGVSLTPAMDLGPNVCTEGLIPTMHGNRWSTGGGGSLAHNHRRSPSSLVPPPPRPVSPIVAPLSKQPW